MHSTSCQFTTLLYFHFLLCHLEKTEERRESCHVSWKCAELCTSVYSSRVPVLYQKFSKTLQRYLISHIFPLRFLFSLLLASPGIIPSSNYDVKQLPLVVFRQMRTGLLTHIKLWVLSNKDKPRVWDFSRKLWNKSNSDKFSGDGASEGASNPFCCPQYMITTGSHSYCSFEAVGFPYLCGPVYRRLGTRQVEMPQSLILLHKSSHFSWMDTHQIVAVFG